MISKADRILFILILLLTLPAVRAQQSAVLKNNEKELSHAFSLIREGTSDSARIILSGSFRDMFLGMLETEGSFAYPWDSLKSIGKMTSPDGLFRIYGWNVPLSGGKNRYFGLIQFGGKMKKKKPVALKDVSDSVEDAWHYRGTSGSWYGSLYYRIIPFGSAGGKTSYILLGWQGIDHETGGKVIDVLSFDQEGNPSFGSKVFTGYDDGSFLRIIFRYSAETGMNLNFRKQLVRGKPLWNPRKRIYESSSEPVEMIVFDHLVPIDPTLEGNYRFYVPSSETAEGFVYENKSWRYLGEFETGNP